MIESELEGRLRDALLVQLQEELTRRQVSFAKSEEATEQEAVAEPRQLEGPMTRARKKRKSVEEMTKLPQTEEEIRDAEIKRLFDLLFEGQKWKEEYTFQQNKGICRVM